MFVRWAIYMPVCLIILNLYPMSMGWGIFSCLMLYISIYAAYELLAPLHFRKIV